MHLNEALAQISEIRRQVDRTATFRGYRSATIGLSGLIAAATAVSQSWFVSDPADDPLAYLRLWVTAAAASVGINGASMWLRCVRSDSPRTARQTIEAIQQFLPCLLTGAALTVVLFHAAHDSLWMLPGLWGILYSLGIFASARILPRAVFVVGLYYLACGLFFLAWGQGNHAFSPWAMGVTFGGGQTLAAAVLYFTLERSTPSGERGGVSPIPSSYPP
jgi:hypothetical protein